ncbi:MAG: adenylate/guanylate cyclase domain-containing protein [Planctomycetota bacterium]|nr:adenylate/guanylate cyclase domain-containing protein [Planctomycetota bacterium]MDA1138212.1 adenylate/guanylate cyclase domain-containing protein [Planctomycetota bacterium]
MPKITFLPDNKTVEAEVEQTILETAGEANVALAHACGGKARCSTCRVAVLGGYEALGERNDKEQALADKLHFEPSVRLSCQTKVTSDTTLRRLVLDEEDLQEANQLHRHDAASAGEEKDLAILFSDIRGFTTFSESLLPYDVIHVLNKYFRRVGHIIGLNGGHIDNYMGDGVLALFGVDGAEDSTFRAVKSGLEMLEAVEDMKAYLSQSYGKTFEIGVGIHFGEAVVGTIGCGPSQRETVIGDSVNFASRIESANKEAGTMLLISADALAEVTGRVNAKPAITTTLKGKSGEHTLHEVTSLNPA